MSDQFEAELRKLSEHLNIPLDDIVFSGSVNARIKAVGGVLAEVNKKLVLMPKKKKAEKE